MRIAIGLSLFGALLAVGSTFVGTAARFPLLCASAVFVGSGANMGLIVIQRRAGQAVSTSTERMRMFSWLGIAPSLSNVVGPVAAGFMIDAGGFRAAYALMLRAAAGHLVVHAVDAARGARPRRGPAPSRRRARGRCCPRPG